MSTDTAVNPGFHGVPPNTSVFNVSHRYGPSHIAFKNLRFLITDKPTDATLNQYIDELQRRRVTDVVRVCESTYSAEKLAEAGIECHDWAFDDGTPPPQEIINDWLNLILSRFSSSSTSSSTASPKNASRRQSNGQSAGGGGGSGSGNAGGVSDNDGPCIAVHCVAGLGRAPVLVAIALIEAGLKYEAAVEMIRDVRRGAINAKQLQYLSEYKPKKQLQSVVSNSGKKKGCCIM